MKSIGVRELRQQASALLRLVERGETLQITDRGRPVALMTPLGSAAPLDQLRAAGDTSGVKGTLDDLPPPLPRRRGKPLPSRALERLRAHER